MMFADRRRRMSPAAIKEGIDNLPSGVAFARTNGIVILCNLAMHGLSRALTGGTLQNAETFWKTAEEKAESRSGETCTLRLENGEVWLLSRSGTELDGAPLYEFAAQNVTELSRLNDALRKDNERLAELAARLRRYSRDAQELTRRRELLERKTHTHDELGRLLLATRRYLSPSGGDIDAEELCRRWHINAGLMLEESDIEGETDLLDCLRRAADAVGVKVTVEGWAPRTGAAAELLFAAGSEALTNLLRHAHGNEMLIHAESGQNAYEVVITNNGEQPAEDITEGGGLSSLRRKVEDAGGGMKIVSRPEYRLILTIPREER
jgi:anti-sigma regulatory factor (Ser/Thr protein kinase)